MKIDIDNVGSADYYDEFLFIVSNSKKIRKKPNMSIYGLSKSAYCYMTISASMFVFLLIMYLISKNNVFIFLMILFVVIFLLSAFYLFIIKKVLRSVCILLKRVV